MSLNFLLILFNKSRLIESVVGIPHLFVEYQGV